MAKAISQLALATRGPADGAVGLAAFSASDITAFGNGDSNKPSHTTSLLAFARFASGVVHEVNSPLGIALLSAQHAKRHLPEDASKQLTEALDRVIYGIRKSADAIRTVMSDCRYCAVDAGKSAAIDVRDVLRFTTAVMHDWGRRHGCCVKWQLSRESSLVHANPLELEMSLASLIYQSIDAQATAVNLQSSVDGHWIEIAVIDNATSARSGMEIPQGTEPALLPNEFVSGVISGNGGAVSRTLNELGGTTVVIRLPRILEESLPS